MSDHLCRTCGGSGTIDEGIQRAEPCGHCASCMRGDPGGCARPMLDVEPAPECCPDCAGYGYHVEADCYD